MVEFRLGMSLKERITSGFCFHTETTPQDWSDYRQIFLNRVTLTPTLVGSVVGSSLLIACSFGEGLDFATHFKVGLIGGLIGGGLGYYSGMAAQCMNLGILFEKHPKRLLHPEQHQLPK